MKDKYGKYGIYKDWSISKINDDSFEYNGWKVTYGEDGDSEEFSYYDDVMKMIQYYIKSSDNEVETPEQKAARELRENAINREKKIDQILGE